ncbi:MAG: hypothetical protein OQL28_10090 [Sedimenticola sp.]|nr:hypothetical protein [Sedimenticola sp.]
MTETAQILRYRRVVVPLLVSLLLWGIWAFSLHHHHQDATVADSVCQLCQFGMLGNGILPVTGLTLLPVSRWSLVILFTPYLLDTLPLPAQLARAPPPVSPV